MKWMESRFLALPQTESLKGLTSLDLELGAKKKLFLPKDKKIFKEDTRLNTKVACLIFFGEDIFLRIYI